MPLPSLPDGGEHVLSPLRTETRNAPQSRPNTLGFLRN